MTKLLFALLGLNAISMIAVVVIYKRARKAQRRRIVERPNSQYKSPYVMDLESKERWEHLDLSCLHEVNRQEAVKILAKLSVVSTRGLSAYERGFLDRMIEAEGRIRRAERRQAGDGSTRSNAATGGWLTRAG